MNFALLLIPKFGFLGLAAVMEVLFQAGKRLPERRIAWHALGSDDRLVTSSSGASLQPDRAIDRDQRYDVVIVFGAEGASKYANDDVSNWLRFQAAHGAHVGCVMSGAWILARSGLLNGYRCAVHWQEIEAFGEAFPEVRTSSDIYAHDRRRFSCSGGHVAADMMLYLLSKWFGSEVVPQVRETLFHGRLRDPDEGQRMALDSRIGTANPYVLRAVERLEIQTDSPPKIEQICSEVGLSQRRLEQLFRRHLGTTPKQYQTSVRLDRARDLLTATTLSVEEVGLITGFHNPRHFSSAFKKQFGKPPSSIQS